MSQFGIVIQETTSGLNMQYISPDLDSNHEEVIQTTQDERILATQLVNQSKFYSVEVTKSYKIYTYINPNVTDEFGRSGYYAIKLYFHNKYINPFNLISLFDKIEAKYLENKNNNTLAGQDYSTIQSLLDGEEVKSFLYLTEKKQFITYFDPNNLSALTEKLNDEKVFTIEKLYAFDVTKALGEDQVKSYGLNSYNDCKITKASFDNSDHILREITQNNQTIDFRTVNQDNFKIIYPLSFQGTVKYSTTEKKNIPVVDFNELKKPIVIPKPIPSRSPQPKKNITPIIIVAVVGVLVLGIGGYFLKDRFFPPKLELEETDPVLSEGENGNEETNDSIKVEKFEAGKFISNQENSDSVSVKNDYYQINSNQMPKLKNYYFRKTNHNSVEYYASFEDLKSNSNKKKLNGEVLESFLSEISIDTTNWNKIKIEAEKQGLLLPKNKNKENNTSSSANDKSELNRNNNTSNSGEKVSSQRQEKEQKKEEQKKEGTKKREENGNEAVDFNINTELK